MEHAVALPVQNSSLARSLPVGGSLKKANWIELNRRVRRNPDEWCCSESDYYQLVRRLRLRVDQMRVCWYRETPLVYIISPRQNYWRGDDTHAIRWCVVWTAGLQTAALTHRAVSWFIRQFAASCALRQPTKEVDLYTPEDSNAYEELAKQCAESHISLDVFSVANPFSSLADIGRVCELTGGRVAYLPQFEKEKSNNRHHLRTMLQRIVDRDCGYEAVLKIRVSAGLRVDRAYGAFYNPRGPGGNGLDVDEMEFSVIDQDRSVCVTFAYDEHLTENTDVYIQAALLYTRSDGIRCVRVHNLALPVDGLLANVFRFADLDVTCSVWQRIATKQFVDKALMRTNPTAVKDNLVNECVNVLFNYRKHCASSSSSGQLILPESLKLLPLYTLATMKSRAFRGNLTGNPPRGFIDVRADERVMMMGILNSLPVEFAVSAVYPKLYSIHDMPEDIGTFNEDGKFVLPPQLPPTAEKLDEEGIFLLHSAMNCYIYVGPRAPTELLVELFGVEHVDTAENTLDLFEKLESEPEDGLRSRVRDVVEYLNAMMPITQPLEILSKNDWRSSRFMSSLVEDRTRNDVSYVEFLVQVHKKIQQKFH